jgi:hypothetical protein
MKPIRFYLGLFLVTGSGLMLQVVQTRILSVVLWYYLAFLVISMAMFGITAGTVWVYLRRAQFSDRTLTSDLTYFCSALAVATGLCGALQMTLPFVGANSGTQILVWVELAACLALPFFLSGIVVSLALTRSPFRIGRVYGVDLAGAALGCLGVLAVLNFTDGPSAILWIAAVEALAAISFAGSGIGDRVQPAMPFASALSRTNVIFVVLACAAAANSFTALGLQPLFVKNQPEFGDQAPVLVKWNTFARVAVFPAIRGAPAMWGPSPAFHGGDWPIEERIMNIDGDARTTTYRLNGDLGPVGFLKYDVTNIAHFLPGHKRAAVIGVGGGRDMLSARVFGVPDITGVELNPTLVRLLTTEPGFAAFAGFDRMAGLHFHMDEARNWFARSRETFDVIQMSLVDTWAATGAGALTLSENGLYTEDGWKIFFNHLTANGVFTVSRWYSPDNADETGRIVSLATATLLDLGVQDPRQSIFLAASGRIATLVVSRSAFSDQDLDILEKVASDKQYKILLCPGLEPATDMLARIVGSRDKAELWRYTSALPLDLTPPSDDRPFFFNQLPLTDPRRMLEVAMHSNVRGIASGNVAAMAVLVLLFIMSGLVVAYTIVRPLRPAIDDVGRRLAIGGTAYFLLIGIGFMCAEIGLIQRLSIFLGSPTYALSVVLFSLILTTGVGSLVSDRIALSTRPRFIAWSMATAAYLLALPVWLPDLLRDFESSELLARATVSLSAIAPLGLFMGFGFPTGMCLVSAIDRQPMPWFWGINGAAGVLASSLAVATGIAFGINVTFMIGGVCYALLVPAGLLMMGRSEPGIRKTGLPRAEAVSP